MMEQQKTTKNHKKAYFLRENAIFEGILADPKAAFMEAVEDYLDKCKKLGRKHQKTYSGKFVVRVEMVGSKHALHSSYMVFEITRRRKKLLGWSM